MGIATTDCEKIFGDEVSRVINTLKKHTIEIIG